MALTGVKPTAGGFDVVEPIVEDGGLFINFGVSQKDLQAARDKFNARSANDPLNEMLPQDVVVRIEAYEGLSVPPYLEMPSHTPMGSR